MRRIKTIIATALLALTSASAFAQDVCPARAEAEELGYWPYPYTFIQVQGGIGTTFTNDKNFMDLATPTFSLGVGRMFSPVVGARLHFNGYESKGILHQTGTTGTCDYKYKYINSNADVMLNVTNIFRNTYNHAFNLYLLGGLGLSYAWDNDEFTKVAALHHSTIAENTSNAWGKGTNRESLLGHSVRAGLLADVNVMKNLSVGAEVDVTSLSDRFNSKYNDADDWMLTAQLSLTYKFGFKPCEVEKKVAAPVTTQTEYDAAAAAAEAARLEAARKAKAEETARLAKAEAEAKAKKAEADANLKETIFFEIRESDPTKSEIIDKVIEFCNKYPEKTVTISGYADKGTGNAKINKKYAEQRAKRVADALKAKGLSADRIAVSSYGDTVQPYAENDQNRCTIIVGK